MSHEKGLETARIAYAHEDGRVNPYAMRSAIAAYLAATKPTGEVGGLVGRLRNLIEISEVDCERNLYRECADLLERLAHSAHLPQEPAGGCPAS